MGRQKRLWNGIDLCIYYIYNIYTIGGDRMAKERHMFTLDPEIWERLKQYAYERHMNASQAITQLILDAPVKNSPIRGQIVLEGERGQKEQSKQ